MLRVICLTFSISSFAIVVGTVDMQKVLFSVKTGQKLRKKLEDSFNKKKEKLRKQEKEFKKLQEKFNKRVQLLSESARQKEQEGLQKRLVALETKRQKYNKEIREMETRLTGPVVKTIYGIVEEVAAEAKVDLALEVSTSPILYAKNKKDLTNSVIKRHNKKYPGK